MTYYETVLLALDAGPSYSLEIVERIRAKLGRFEAVMICLFLYPTLRALEEEGLVRAWWGEPLPVRGGRPRRMYELTTAGRAKAKEIF
jgi:PadR family transcriptional regulator, regulatory protein PadR